MPGVPSRHRPRSCAAQARPVWGQRPLRRRPRAAHTRTGKKLKVPVKRLLQGAPVGQVANPAAVDDPGLIDHYARLGAARRAQCR